MEENNICSKCGEIAEYYENKRCKGCNRKRAKLYKEANKEKVKEYKTLYRQTEQAKKTSYRSFNEIC